MYDDFWMPPDSYEAPSSVPQETLAGYGAGDTYSPPADTGHWSGLDNVGEGGYDDTGGHWSGLDNVGGGGVSYGEDPGYGSAGSWLQQLYQNFTGGGSGGSTAPSAFAPTSGAGSWMTPLMSLTSGGYGMYLANKQRQQAKAAIAGSAPWTASGGTAMAGDQLKSVISGDFTNDAGFKAAQQSAARASSQQPGGFAASAAAQAALRYQNERIGALGAPAGVGFSPASGYQIATQGTQAANQLASSSLGSIGYGATGSSAGTQMPPWLQSYFIKNGMGAQP